jgi:hypothetical protein
MEKLVMLWKNLLGPTAKWTLRQEGKDFDVVFLTLTVITCALGQTR